MPMGWAIWSETLDLAYVTLWYCDWDSSFLWVLFCCWCDQLLSRIGWTVRLLCGNLREAEVKGKAHLFNFVDCFDERYAGWFFFQCYVPLKDCLLSIRRGAKVCLISCHDNDLFFIFYVNLSLPPIFIIVSALGTVTLSHTCVYVWPKTYAYARSRTHTDIHTVSSAFTSSKHIAVLTMTIAFLSAKVNLCTACSLSSCRAVVSRHVL